VMVPGESPGRIGLFRRRGMAIIGCRYPALHTIFVVFPLFDISG